MIPKIIHYCWFGRGKMSDETLQYIESWKKYCSDYQFKIWNEDNFDISVNSFVREAYRNKKYAFVADYARLLALYTEGGIYMDTDVEVIKSLNPLLQNHSFTGFEDWNLVQTGIIGAEAGSKWLKKELEYYDHQSFIRWNGAFNTTPNTQILSKHFLEYGLEANGEYQVLNNGIVLYPRDFFAPKSYVTHQTTVTENTYIIHHFADSWKKKNKPEQRLEKCFGELWGSRAFKLYHLIRKIILFL